MSLFRAFYGREEELSFLVRAVREARSANRASVVLIEGEAGIGKTRLISELRLATRTERVAFLVGRSAEYLRAPYEPFVDALDGEPDGKSIEEALRAAPSQRTTSSEEERARRFRLVERFLRKRATSRGAVVLVIEDLHWSDAASLDLFRHLAHRMDDVASVLIGTYRGTDVDKYPGAQAAIERLRREGAGSIVLDAWPDEVIAGAIHDTLSPGALSEARIRTICQLAEGRPYIAEELLRDALDAGKRNAGGTALPLGSVGRYVHERLRALSPEEQQVLMYAAVIGRDFDVALLARLTGLSVEHILSAIRTARRAQLVAEDVHSGRFAFRHALTREILYNELLGTEIRTLHARIARALEEEGEEASIESIAYHWWAARDAQRATTANEAAGDRASAIAAPADAARFYERALDFAPALSDPRFSLLRKVVEAHNDAGDGQSCLAWCEKAITELGAARRHDEVMRFTLRAAHQQYALGNLSDAKTMIQTVREQLRATPSSTRHLSAELSLALVLVAEGSAAEALCVLHDAEESDHAWTPRERFRDFTIRGNAYAALGRFGESFESYRQALQTAVAAGDVPLEILARNNLAVTAMSIGDTHEAKRTYEEALVAAERFGLRGERNIVAANLAHCLLQIGELSEARRIAEKTRNDDAAMVAPAVLCACVELRLDEMLGQAKTKDHRWIQDLVKRAFRTGSSELAAAASGAAALALRSRGHDAAAKAVMHEGIQQVSSLESYHWLLEATAEMGEPDEVRRARDLLVAGAAHGANKLAGAHLRLFDARVARRAGHFSEAASLALIARDAFRALSWPAEAAASCEVAGDLEGALAAYRAMGASRQVRRLEDALGRRRTRPANDLGLSRRQEEVARLLVRGYSNRTVADELGIGERTVETHVTSIFHKLGISSRSELVARLSDGP